MKTTRGFTLVEVLVALTVIGIILAAVFFFVKGTTRGAESMEMAATASETRLGAARLETLLANAGYMGEVFPGAWQPVITAEENRFTFVANLTDPQSFGPEDTVTVLSENGTVTITDASGAQFMAPVAGEAAFQYFDAAGQTADEPGMVRRIDFTLTAEGSSAGGTAAPYNLAAAGDPAMLRDLFLEYGGGEGSRFEHVIFLEDFETPTPFAFEDHMEAGDMWVPIITEYFEDPVSWNNNWELYIEDDGYGRVRRWTDSEAYEGQSCLALDCYRTGNSTQMAVWSVDLSAYDEYSDDLRLHFFWKEFNDVLNYEDGVFLPVWVPDNQTEVVNEDFSGFRQGFVPRDWTFWSNDYGRVEVVSNYPTDGNYLNLDTRRYGYTGTSRVMVTMDLSAYAGSSDIELSFDMCSRGSPNSAFVGLIGTGGITSDPVAQQNLNPGAYPAGSWTTVTIDIDAMLPAGYDLSNTKLIFAQSGTLNTAGATYYGGISIDNVVVANGTEGYWDMSNRILAAPASFPNWTEATLDLSQAARNAGIPFSSNFLIGFSQRGTEPIDVNGIAYDQIAVEEMGWGMEGWTHGPWPGYSLSEWEPSNHAAYSGNWCYATAGSGSYQATPTRSWLQSPVIDLTGYAPGERMAIAFFHRYSFGTSGDGCNVKMTKDNGENWDLIVPYWGYYTASVPALGNEPGWTGATGSGVWNFSVIDITEYAGEEVRLRFNYGTTGSSSNTGWELDYTRSRAGADWPQIIWGYTPEKADWFAYTWVNSGSYDPTSTPDGSRWAGNDMGTWGIWDLQYEDDQHNALITPPIVYTMDNYDTFAYMEFYASPRFESGYDYGYVQAARFSDIAPHPFDDWHTFCTVNSVHSGWGHYRYRVDALPSTVFGPNRTVVFRWRMTSDGSVTEGGWNIDRLRFFSSDVWLPDVTHGPVNGRDPGGIIETDSPKGPGYQPRVPPYRHEIPVFLPLHSQNGTEVTQ